MRSTDYEQTIMAPLAALTVACLLFVYARTSIRAAKLNAKKHREADGGQISWHKESLRRHPPAHFVVTHAVTRPCELGGYKVPADALVNFDVAGIGMDPTVCKRNQIREIKCFGFKLYLDYPLTSKEHQ